jgi:hypothetical protein
MREHHAPVTGYKLDRRMAKEHAVFSPAAIM